MVFTYKSLIWMRLQMVIDPGTAITCMQRERPPSGAVFSESGRLSVSILTSFEKMYATENSAEAAWNQ
jgi:hypothetical protein